MSFVIVYFVDYIGNFEELTICAYTFVYYSVTTDTTNFVAPEQPLTNQFEKNEHIWGRASSIYGGIMERNVMWLGKTKLYT